MKKSVITILETIFGLLFNMLTIKASFLGATVLLYVAGFVAYKTTEGITPPSNSPAVVLLGLLYGAFLISAIALIVWFIRNLIKNQPVHKPFFISVGLWAFLILTSVLTIVSLG